MKYSILALSLLFGCSLNSVAGTTVVPTTTLTAETANNTSGSNSWTNTTTGNAVAGNVSQVDVHKLLYAGESAKVYAHYLGWWGPGGGHISNGTNSATLSQAHATITDMMNRGIDGLIIDWYGAGNTHIDLASQYIKQDAETRGGKFTFAIMEDQGAVRSCAYATGCNATQAVINDLNYINSTYASSSAYMRVNGRPVIFTFDTENLPNINWSTVLASVQGNPVIVLRNDNGFRISWTSGSYSWVVINTSNSDDWGQNYLNDFYATSRSYPSEQVYAGVWKGFNDLLASWSADRIVNQNCGQTWLSTFSEMNKYFSSTQQPTAVQLVTWNDYEEGTEIETGIDNCVSVSGSMAGNTLEWSINGGQENTIDHYTVFISLDGQSLMKVADVPAGTHQLALDSYGFAPANYTLYVKAIGQPSILNKMSAAIPFTVGNQPPVAALSVTPTSGSAPVVVTASTAGSSDPNGMIASSSIDFGDGTVVSGSNASHTYSTAGTYTVTATVTDNLGATASRSATVTVAQPFVITPVMPLSGTTVSNMVHFVATAASANPVSAMRIYVDNQSLYTVSASSIDTTLKLAAGSHYVVLQGWDSKGAVAKTPLNITVVNSTPKVSLAATPTSGVGPMTVDVTATGTTDYGTVTGMSIDFGDGTVMNGGSGTHMYDGTGTYTLTATVTDSNGNSASTEMSVSVKGWGERPVRPPRAPVNPAPLAVSGTSHTRRVVNRLQVRPVMDMNAAGLVAPMVSRPTPLVIVWPVVLAPVPDTRVDDNSPESKNQDN